jgi:hypothetical protein
MRDAADVVGDSLSISHEKLAMLEVKFTGM